VVALAWVVGHGGVAGAIVETLVVLAVIAVLLAVWLRERRGRRSASEAETRLRDD
jgi:hypothetical protein